MPTLLKYLVRTLNLCTEDKFKVTGFEPVWIDVILGPL